jgi:hypothetical protein
VPGDLAGDITVPVVLLLAVAGAAALGLSFSPAAVQGRRWVAPSLAAAVAAGCVWLVLYAIGDDTYYAPGDVSRWEHASDTGLAFVVVAALVIALASIVALLGAPSRTRIAMAATAVACGALIVAAFLIGIGH